MSDADGDLGTAAPDEHWLTSILRADVTVLRIAEEAAAGAGDAATGALAARRALDEQLRQLTGWPRPQDYARIAADFDAAGWPHEAMLLRQVAATSELAAEASARWNHRYTSRPVGPAEEMIRHLDAGMADLDPGGPYRGIDGALYRPGTLSAGEQQHPFIIVSARGGPALAVGWDGYDAMSAWVASRGTTGSGALAAPKVPSADLFRPWQEEAVLARMLAAPGEAPALTAQLPPDTFTCDARYDIYAAIVAVASQGQAATPQRVAGELDHRLVWVPDHALPAYGGPGGRTAMAYLSRLADTSATAAEADQAAEAMIASDATDRSRNLLRSPDYTEDPGPRPQHMPEHAAWFQLSGLAQATGSAPALSAARARQPASSVVTGHVLHAPQQPGAHGPVMRM